MSRDLHEGELTPKRLEFMRTCMILTYVQRCGMCGATRHPMKPFWSLRMNVCKYCVLDNLISEHILSETYGMHIWSTLPDGSVFANAVQGKVLYFQEHTNLSSRLYFSQHPRDFLFRSSTDLYFWKPHLEKLMDLPALRETATEKQAAAGSIRAYVRRSLLMRKLSRKPAARREDKRPVYASLMKEHIQQQTARLCPAPPKTRRYLDAYQALTTTQDRVDYPEAPSSAASIQNLP